MEYKWCASLPLLRGARGMKKNRSNIPPTPLKRGGRGGGSVFTQWIPPYLHVVYKWCVSLPLLRGARGMKNPEENIPPTPLKRGGLSRLVSSLGHKAGVVGFFHWIYCCRPTVCIDPPPRTPLFRGAGGMHLSLLLIFHTPAPFQKGSAGAVGSLPFGYTAANSHVGSDPPTRAPLFRGAGGMHL